MKLDPHLPQLPSIADLLEHPRVKGLVSRINRSTVARRAAEFVDDMRSSLAKRTGAVEIPSVTHLAERLARWLIADAGESGAIINATGVVVGAFPPPLAEQAVEAVAHVASEYDSGGAGARQYVEGRLCRLTGAESALVVSRLDAAAALVLAATAGQREAMLFEGPAPGDLDLPWGVLGSIASTAVGNFGDVEPSCHDLLKDRLARPGLGAVLVAEEATSGSVLEKLGQLAAVLKNRGVALVDVAPWAGLVNPDRYGLQSIATAAERLRAGADAVLLDGAGLLGGPSAGLILGSRDIVDRCSGASLATLLAPPASACAALGATLARYEDDDPDAVKFSIPVWQLLSTPLANLEQRAARLAALLATCAEVASAEALPLDSNWLRAPRRQVASSPSWAVRVRPRRLSAAAALPLLRRRQLLIAAEQADDAIQLDMRSVFPRWDQEILEAFEHLDK